LTKLSAPITISFQSSVGCQEPSFRLCALARLG
jgi:hypothetical protein